MQMDRQTASIPASITAEPQAPNRTQMAAREVLDGRRRGLRAFIPFFGPAFIAAVAYVDPGNYATNIQSGSAFGYRLLWVIVLANLMAMLLQNLSAKLGVATGKNLPELCREYYSPRISMVMWGVSEIAAMATDLAEFLGATLALYLLLHVPLLVGTVIIGAVTYLILMVERYGFRSLEVIIGGMVGIIAACYLIEVILAHPSWSSVGYHAVMPWLGGPSSILLSVGIVGATVMPHVVYLHSGLTQRRIIPANGHEAWRIQRYGTVDVIIAMTLAGCINMAMLMMAASAFHHAGFTHIADISVAYKTLTPLLGGAAAAVFLISLMASGLSSSAVGTMAGQVIMQGFVGFSIPLWIRRIVTMVPTVVVVALGVNPTMTLVVSQVVLSLVLPIPVLALVRFTNRPDVMGPLVNRPLITVLAYTCVVAIIVLNLVLLWQTASLPLPSGI